MTASISGGNKSFAFGMQQIAQRLHFGGKALHFAFGRFQRRARLGFGGFGAVQSDARAPAARAARLSPARAPLRSALSAAAGHPARPSRLPSPGRGAPAASPSCVALVSASADARSRPRSWLALSAFQSASSAVRRSSSRSASASASFSSRGVRFGGGKFVAARARWRRFERLSFAARACQARLRVTVERLFALGVLRRPGAMRWRRRCGRLAGARFLGVELLRAATIRR